MTDRRQQFMHKCDKVFFNESKNLSLEQINKIKYIWDKCPEIKSLVK